MAHVHGLGDVGRAEVDDDGLARAFVRVSVAHALRLDRLDDDAPQLPAVDADVDVRTRRGRDQALDVLGELRRDLGRQRRRRHLLGLGHDEARDGQVAHGRIARQLDLDVAGGDAGQA